MTAKNVEPTGDPRSGIEPKKIPKKILGNRSDLIKFFILSNLVNTFCLKFNLEGSCVDVQTKALSRSGPELFHKKGS